MFSGAALIPPMPADSFVIGAIYATAIFANSPEQKKITEASRAMLKKSGVLKRSVVTPVRTAGAFYPAEGYHQDYYTKNPLGYKFYRLSCGRDARIKELWGADAHRGSKSTNSPAAAPPQSRKFTY